jgi:hypothetical protein
LPRPAHIISNAPRFNASMRPITLTHLEIVSIVAQRPLQSLVH